MRRTVAVAVLTGLTWGLTACGAEEEPYYDGADSSVVAGVADRLGSRVIAPDAPSGATSAEVTSALDAAGLAGADEVTDGLAIDTGAVAGLLGVVGDADTYVVLVFDDPASAAVFTESEPTVLDGDAAGSGSLLFSGNLLAVTEAGADPVRAKLRAALRALARGPA